MCVSVVFMCLDVVLFIVLIMLCWLVGLCMLCVGVLVSVLLVSIGVVCYGWCVFVSSVDDSDVRWCLFDRLRFIELGCLLLYRLCGSGIFVCGVLSGMIFDVLLIGLVMSFFIDMVLLVMWFMNDVFVLFFSRWCMRYVSSVLCVLIGVYMWYGWFSLL